MYTILTIPTLLFIIDTRYTYKRHFGAVIICFVFDSREIIDTPAEPFPKIHRFQICRPPMGCCGVYRARTRPK